MSNLLDFEKAMVKFYQNIETTIEKNIKFIQDNKNSESLWDKKICETLVIENRALLKQRNDFGVILWRFGIDARLPLNNSKQFEDDSNVPELEAEKSIIEKK